MMEKLNLGKVARNATVAAGLLITAGGVEAQNTTQQEVMLKKDNPQREAYKTYENYKKYVARMGDGSQTIMSEKEFQKVAKEVMGAFEKADTERQWLLNIMSSLEYRKRAGIEGLTQEDIQKRIERVRTDFYIADPFHTINDAFDGEYLTEKALKDSHAYDLNPGEMAIRAPREMLNPSAIHESEHRATDGLDSMSQLAKVIYLQSHNAPDPNKPEASKHYISDPTELDARKKTFEYEMERNNIWKYGDREFTMEHLKKALELYKERKLSNDSMEFILSMKNIDSLLRIMNIIADSGIHTRHLDDSDEA